MCPNDLSQISPVITACVSADCHSTVTPRSRKLRRLDHREPLTVTLNFQMHWPERRMGAAAVILDADGRVLLVRHTYGPLNWELPGGASEPGESIVDTALREVREETGLEARAERLTGIYYDLEYDAHHFVFRCSVSSDARAAATSAEISVCDYWPAAALPRPISDFTIRRITDALDGAAVVLPTAIPARAWLE
jgi:8-oxo-dGTP pyrophosphatase MutT (NUDIX family)